MQPGTLLVYIHVLLYLNNQLKLQLLITTVIGYVEMTHTRCNKLEGE
jgi:hypothetical protein